MSSTRKDYNSVSQILEEFLSVHYETLSLLKAISESASTSEQTVAFTSTRNGVAVNYKLPSFTYLLKRVNELSANVEQLKQVKNQEFNQPIFGAEVISEPGQIGAINFPTVFYTQPNWFFENLINPLLYIKVDVTKYIHTQSKFLTSLRLICKLDTADKIKYFNDNFTGDTILDYKTTLSKLASYPITYSLDEETHILPALVLKNSGKFSVVKIGTNIIDNPLYSVVREYTLNTIKYLDLSNGKPIDKLLQPNDVLLTATGDIAYVVIKVNQVDNVVTLGLKTGFGAVGIGADVLKIASPLVGNKEVNISVGSNEANIIFLKAVDPFYHTTTQNWGDGFAFLTSNLSTTTATGEIIKFDAYYTRFVQDFGIVLKGLLKDNNKSAYYGDKPNAPVLTTDNFKVVRINSHLNSSEDTAKIISYIQKKEDLEFKLQTQLDLQAAEPAANRSKYDLAISTLRINIADNDKLILQYKGSLDAGTYTIDPVYNIRGFAVLPKTPYNTTIGTQEIVQILFSYRYLDMAGTPIASSQHPITDINNTPVSAVYSNWIEIYSPVRKKVYDNKSDGYLWDKIDNTDAETININQIAIPITQNEQIQLRARVITEAGFPTNPLMSDWCAPIILKFDTTKFIKDLATEAIAENIRYYQLEIETKQCCSKNSIEIESLTNRLVGISDILTVLTGKMDQIYPLVITGATGYTGPCEIVYSYTCPPGYSAGYATGCYCTNITTVLANIPPTSAATPIGPDFGYVYRADAIIDGGVGDIWSCIDLPGIGTTGCVGVNPVPTGWVAIGCLTGCSVTRGGWVLVKSTNTEASSILSPLGCTMIVGTGPSITT